MKPRNILGFVQQLLRLSCCLGLVSSSAWAQPPAAPAAPVEVASVERREMAPMGWVPGSVVSRDDARVAAEFAGRLTWVAELGQALRKGEVLARIERRPLELILRRDEAEIRRLEAQLGYLNQQLARLEKLTAEQVAAQVRLDEIRSQRAMAEQDLELAQVTRDQTLDRLARCQVKAPFPGKVVERLRQPGEYIQVGEAVVRVVNVGRPEIRAQASPEAVPHLREGMPLEVDVGGRKAQGRLRTVVPVGDERSRLFEVRVTLPETRPEERWLVGSAARLALPGGALRKALTVPRDALVLRQGETVVFRLDAADGVERVPVSTGAAQGARIEVRGGLEAGDRVVIRGAERLQPGQKVQVKAPSP